MWHLLSQSLQVFFGFPLFPSQRLSSNDKVVRRVQHANPTPIFRLILEFDGGWLVVERENGRIMLHFIHPCQLIFVAFGLNGDSHFVAGVENGNVLPPAAYPAGGWG